MKTRTPDEQSYAPERAAPRGKRSRKHLRGGATFEQLSILALCALGVFGVFAMLGSSIEEVLIGDGEVHSPASVAALPSNPDRFDPDFPLGIDLPGSSYDGDAAPLFLGGHGIGGDEAAAATHGLGLAESPAVERTGPADGTRRGSTTARDGAAEIGADPEGLSPLERGGRGDSEIGADPEGLSPLERGGRGDGAGVLAEDPEGLSPLVHGGRGDGAGVLGADPEGLLPLEHGGRGDGAGVLGADPEGLSPLAGGGGGDGAGDLAGDPEGLLPLDGAPHGAGGREFSSAGGGRRFPTVGEQLIELDRDECSGWHCGLSSFAADRLDDWTGVHDWIDDHDYARKALDGAHRWVDERFVDARIALAESSWGSRPSVIPGLDNDEALAFVHGVVDGTFGVAEGFLALAHFATIDLPLANPRTTLSIKGYVDSVLEDPSRLIEDGGSLLHGVFVDPAEQGWQCVTGDLYTCGTLAPDIAISLATGGAGRAERAITGGRRALQVAREGGSRALLRAGIGRVDDVVRRWGADQRWRDVNPGYACDFGRKVNCQRVVVAVDHSLEGNLSSALRHPGAGVQPPPPFQGMGGDMTLQEIAESLSAPGRWSPPTLTSQALGDVARWGHGAKGVLFVEWRGGGSHVVNVVNDNGVVVVLDGQSGVLLTADEFLLENAAHISSASVIRTEDWVGS